MPNEELVQRKYLQDGKLKGDNFGDFEVFVIGSTTVKELVSSGVDATAPGKINYPFKLYKPPQKPASAKPDNVYVRRKGTVLEPVAAGESKAHKRLRDANAVLKASEQALYAAVALGVRIAFTTDGKRCLYVDVEKSLKKKEIVYFEEKRDWNPAVLQNLLAGDAGVVKDPKPLAEKVWQIIWHATKEEPKECLLTFIEIFVLKFLSDNLPQSSLPASFSFYELVKDPKEFQQRHGKTAIEYYVSDIRPKIKSLFPDNVIVADPVVPRIFGLSTLVSKTSIINGFAFLKSSADTVATFNRTFLEILDAFRDFGPLASIDPEFKLRLYETFLRRSARQQKLGQFFTPRNVVQSMIKMARLSKLPDKSIVLDPAAGVGGFVLEPLLFADALPDNIRFEKGTPKRRVYTIGVDVDPNLHILGKANMLLHLAEAVRNPSTTISAINTALAETFVLMNENGTLGALLNPPRGCVDVVLTNPPYVTKGSGVYKKELGEMKDAMRNGVDLRDYYNGCGLGVETLFLRYISGALKPGGRAYVIVPLGMLNRTEPGPKERLLKECNLLASIQLPRNTFFNTSQKTYIMILEKRHTEVDARPDVFCAVARSIGESLDWRRIPTPEENDLDRIAEMFIAFCEGIHFPADASPLVKVVPATNFEKDDRWDVGRFWSDAEMVALGEKESPIPRVDFVEEAQQAILQIATELESSQAELVTLSSGPSRSVSLSDLSIFTVRSGTRIKSEDIRLNPGDVPVYSCFKESTIIKGKADEKWLTSRGVRIETEPIVTVNANGASVGKVYARNERCALTDDVIAIEVRQPDIDHDYMAFRLREAVAAGGFLYEAKLFTARVRELEVTLPTKPDGSFDLECQKKIATAERKFESTRRKLIEVGRWSDNARII